ncbi:hypothetical protein DdX_16239 [Ditylenchus destructor]|uniref:Secreted protein n=1 Tax=Ditylenchus destructor TaxID=166010 RepID=A0AAD4QU59_9BILA|nr:hypothetical protein DdX_16239 [Ditylenchus destructor]
MKISIGIGLILASLSRVMAMDFIEFLFHNQQICGNPFSDAQWVPVLDLCQVKCNEPTEICVENDDLKQKCNKLPQTCVDAWLKTGQRPLGRGLSQILPDTPPQKTTRAPPKSRPSSSRTAVQPERLRPLSTTPLDSPKIQSPKNEKVESSEEEDPLLAEFNRRKFAEQNEEEDENEE